MRHNLLAILMLAACNGEEPSTASNTQALDGETCFNSREFPLALTAPGDAQIPTFVSVDIDVRDQFSGTALIMDQLFSINFSEDGESRYTEIVNLWTGDYAHASQNGEEWKLVFSADDVIVELDSGSEVDGVELRPTARTQLLALALELPESLQWVDDAVCEAEPTIPVCLMNGGGGNRTGGRWPKQVDPKDVAKKAGIWGYIVVIGGAIVGACVGSENTCNGAVEYLCPDGTDKAGQKITDDCGCGPSICNTCLNTCANECTPGTPPSCNNPPPAK